MVDSRLLHRGVLPEALKEELMMQSQLRNAHNRAYKHDNESRHSNIEHNEWLDSSLHDSSAERYFERLFRNGREINSQAGEVLR